MEEDEFRGVGNVVRTPDEDLFSDAWETLLGLPEAVYVVYPGYSCDDMELWKLRVIGQKRVRGEDHWVFKHDRPLWQGPAASSRREIGKTYITTKRRSFLTLAGAKAQFEIEWKKHVERYRSEVVRLTESISTYQRDRDIYLGRIQATESGPIDVLTLIEAEDSK